MTEPFKVYRCWQCGCLCSDESNLYNHISAFHPETSKEKPYCAVCEKRVDKLCDLSSPTHIWEGCNVVTCENMPEGKIVKLDSKYSRVPPEPTFTPKVTLKRESETCANCHYFRYHQCYEKPPAVFCVPLPDNYEDRHKTVTLRPEVDSDDFCGQFTRRKN